MTATVATAPTALITAEPLAQAPPPPERRWRAPRQLAACYAAFAVYAAAVAIFSGPGNDRSWAVWSAGGYAVAAAAVTWRRPRGKDVALLTSLAGALAGPMAWLAVTAPPTPDVQVVSRSAVLLLRHGTPYLPAAHLSGWLAYNPYLPVMSVFGLPRAAGVPGVAGDPRVWLAAVTAALFVAAFRIAGTRDALRWGLFAVASPVAAFPLALGITDPPVLALTCLALAVLGRASRVRPGWPAAVIVGVACATKYTAWPALVVLTAMVVARDGIRAGVRFAATAVAATVALVVAFAPAAATRPAALVLNTVAFPLGLTRAKSPAASPLPGHVLAAAGTDGKLAAAALIAAAGLAVAISLAARPPAGSPAAARRLALGLALMFMLAPASRFGYFAYPAGLLGWLALTGRAVAAPGARLRRVQLAVANAASSWGPMIAAAPRPECHVQAMPIAATRPVARSMRSAPATAAGSGPPGAG